MPLAGSQTAATAHGGEFTYSGRNDFLELCKTEFEEYKLNLSVYLSNSNKLTGGDRKIITNYNHCETGHPFDRLTTITSDYLFTDTDLDYRRRINTIRNKYNEVNSLLARLKQNYSSSPPTCGLIKLKFGNILENKIFQ